MTTAKAIAKLREKLGLNQQEFGKLLAVSYKTISRYENGQEPTTKVLLQLASISKSAGLGALAALFAAARESNIAARAENLSSQGAAPRVPIMELHRWADALKRIIQDDSHDQCKHFAYLILNEISPYITHVPTPREINEANAKFWSRPENQGKAGSDAKSRGRSKR